MTTVKKEGKADGEPTHLVRYDLYLNMEHDVTLIAHLDPFKVGRRTNGEMRRLMYAGLSPVEAQPIHQNTPRPAVVSMVATEPTPKNINGLTERQIKLKRQFG